MRVLLVVALLAGCTPDLPEGRILCATSSDCPPSWHCSRDRCYRSPPAAGIDASTCSFPYAPSTIDPCALDEASDDWTISAETVYDTDTGTPDVGPVPQSDRVEQLAAGAPMVRVIRVRNLAIEAAGRLTVAGSLPLVVLAWGDVTIDGTLDATGLMHASCTDGAGGRGDRFEGAAPRGAGGGGGGGHGAMGGPGGDSVGELATTEGGIGGTEQGNPRLLPLVGGCPGGGGGEVGPFSSGGAGGAPGGAVQISAAGSVTIVGTVDGGGEGGGAGDWYNSEFKGDGGGGGGAGGAIAIEGAEVVLAATGRICANGGGGGGGGCNSSSATAGAPASCDFATGAPGGTGAAAGGPGGHGASAAGAPGADADGPCGGAGGGGAVGRIRIRSLTSPLSRHPDAVVSPTPAE